MSKTTTLKKQPNVERHKLATNASFTTNNQHNQDIKTMTENKDKKVQSIDKPLKQKINILTDCPTLLSQDTEKSEEEKKKKIALTRCKAFYEEGREVKSQEEHKYLISKEVVHFDRLKINIYKNKNVLCIPMYNHLFEFKGLQMVFEDGSKQNYPRTTKKDLFFIIGANSEKELRDSYLISVTEGFSTASSLYAATNIPCIATFGSNNLYNESIVKIKKKNPNLTLRIAADNDLWKKDVEGKRVKRENNIGLNAAREAARKYECEVTYPKFNEGECQGFLKKYDELPSDFNDLNRYKGKEVVDKQYNDTKKYTEIEKKFDESAERSCPYLLTQNGLFQKVEKENKKTGEIEEKYYWMAARIDILSRTRDKESSNWGVTVRFKDEDKIDHIITFSMEQIQQGNCEEVCQQLAAEGLVFNRTLKSRIMDYFAIAPISKRAICATKVGWHGDCFVLPSVTIPETSNVYLQNANYEFSGYTTSGTLKEWQEYVAKPCKGNSRLLFALGVAFAPIILPFIKTESFVINLKGESSIGKTAVANIAASAWGYPKEYIQLWRNTGNALEGIAEAHNNMLFILDELGQINPKEAGEITYLLANGQGKGRMKANGAIRKKYTWNLIALSTAEMTFADKIKESGKEPRAGMMMRALDVDADVGKGHGVFDALYKFEDKELSKNNLNDYSSLNNDEEIKSLVNSLIEPETRKIKNGMNFTFYFQEVTKRFYGIPAREFINRINKEEIKNALAKGTKAIQEDLLKEHNMDASNSSSAQVGRAAMNFAICIAAGELAISCGVLPFKENSIFESTSQCFGDWLSLRGSNKPLEEENLITQAREFFESNFASRFIDCNEDAKNINGYEEKIKTRDVAGFKEEIDGSFHFYVFPASYKEIYKGYDRKLANKVFIEKGFIIPAKDGKSFIEKRLPIGKKKIYYFAPSVLIDEKVVE